MKKALCLLLSLLMIFLCGCGQKEKKENNKSTFTTKGKGKISLLYCFGDTFDPYTAKTELNRRLCTLLYDPLFKVDNNYKAKYCLAESADVTATTVTVRIKDAVFSDGTPITSNDVMFSYVRAKHSATGGFDSKLYEVTGITPTDEKTVIFSLSRSDPYILNLLTFPIIKAGTTDKFDSDGMAIPPTGSGRFVVSADHENLAPNGNYSESKGSITAIRLINAPDGDSIEHYVEIGAVDIYYTDGADGKIVRMEANRSEINLNRFIYVGINTTNSFLAQREMRYALSSAIDRSATVSGAFYGNATVATGFFNPAFKDASSTGTLEKGANKQITIENLAKIGYNKLNASGYYENASGFHPAFTILVNSENAARVRAAELICAQAKSSGIEITVVQKPYDGYIQALQSGNFQLYLGETEILPNMDFSGLCAPGGSAAYGVTNSADTNLPLSTAFNSYFAQQLSVNDVSGVLLSEMQQIPICYRKGLLFSSQRIKTQAEGTLTDVFYNILDYKF